MVVKGGVLFVYCVCGGMCSVYVVEFLIYLGLDTVWLEGGYKVFWYWVLECTEKQFIVVIVVGLIGMGKI